MAGYTQCLVAAITHALADEVGPPSLGAGILAGLSASRLLHSEGFQVDGAAVKGDPPPTDFEFPVDRVANEIREGCEGKSASASVFRDMAIQEAREWSMITVDEPFGLAREIIKRGPKAALHGHPICTFSDLITVDRKEAKSLRSIRALIAEYARNRLPAKPLSIAVFGQPGSGKSFAVEQVMEALRQ
jgi:hypothetical protein